MNRSLQLGLVGFVIGGLIILFLELDTGVFRTPQTSQAASQKDKLESQQATRSSAQRQSLNKDTLHNENLRLRHKIDTLKRENERLANANTPAPGMIIQARQKPCPRETSNTNVRSIEAMSSFQIRMRRILIGQEAIAVGALPESTLEKHAKHNKYLVYFELSFTNLGEQSRHVNSVDFRLEDSNGFIYSPLRSRDDLSDEIVAGKTAQGGVAFAVYNDSAPARLLYRTGPERFTPLPESVFWLGHGDKQQVP